MISEPSFCQSETCLYYLQTKQYLAILDYGISVMREEDKSAPFKEEMEPGNVLWIWAKGSILGLIKKANLIPIRYSIFMQHDINKRQQDLTLFLCVKHLIVILLDVISRF
ncbi:unnamed protein product [Cuscuta epithymum]|uniref:Uncharacterized protein n=1 Tax=Cuscuta epithymum TaxID=186058 RepID=A0AAV0FU71_9ASTE|nr:unnamed protein product [Cuscuta epithymum]